MRALIDERVGASLPTDECNRISKQDHAFRATRREFSRPERRVPIVVVAKAKPGALVRSNGLVYIGGQRALPLVTD